MSTTGKLRTGWPLLDEWTPLLQMDQDFFPRPWRPEQWWELNPQHYRLYRWGGVGFALLAHVPADETAHLLKICLHPDDRGTGEAQLFWNDVLQDLLLHGVSRVYLEVEESNRRARAYYQKLGFEVVRTAKGYYSDGENAVIMTLTL